MVPIEGPAAAALLGLPGVHSNPASCVWFGAAAPPLRDRYMVSTAPGLARR